MNLNAQMKTIKDILDTNKKYVIPRFQRRYSWDKPQLETFFHDIVSLIDKETLETSEYFVGSIVLVEKENRDILDVVDGQQRLTTCTILLSVLTHIFDSLDEESLAQSCYMYVEGKDSNFEPFFKLTNTSSNRFFVKRIQTYKPTYDIDAITEEEKKLLQTYNYFSKMLNEKNIYKFFSSNHNHAHILRSIRDQLIRMKTIYISIDSLDDAYTIFETLNAKGLDLSTLDLVKNKIFSHMKDVHPFDEAQDLWSQIEEVATIMGKKVDLNQVFRHYWLSKHGVVTQKNLYLTFTKTLTPADYYDFLVAFSKSLTDYSKIISPNITDWRFQEEKEVFYSLNALKTFNVSICNSLLLAVLDARERKTISLTDFVNTLELIENFHFQYTAICSFNSASLENKYSQVAIRIRKLEDREQFNAIYNDLKGFYVSKAPSYNQFMNKFRRLKFTSNYTAQKDLIRYYFATLERRMRNTDELTTNNLTLEHISPQAHAVDQVGSVGNLIPLSKNLNQKAATKSLVEKMTEYRESELKVVKLFVDDFEGKDSWEVEDIKKRTTELGKKAYYDIWKLK